MMCPMEAWIASMLSALALPKFGLSTVERGTDFAVYPNTRTVGFGVRLIAELATAVARDR